MPVVDVGVRRSRVYASTNLFWRQAYGYGPERPGSGPHGTHAGLRSWADRRGHDRAISRVCDLAPPLPRAKMCAQTLVLILIDVLVFAEPTDLVRNVTVVSITGGNRDTLVNADLVDVSAIAPASHSFTAFTTGIPHVWLAVEHEVCVCSCVPPFRRALVLSKAHPFGDVCPAVHAHARRCCGAIKSRKRLRVSCWLCATPPSPRARSRSRHA